MNEEVLDLSNQKYLVVVRLEETSDGGYVYTASHPELPGCMSQGNTPEEAETNLAEARQMIIEHLVTNRLPVPEPSPFPGTLVETQSFEHGKEQEFKLSAPSIQAKVLISR